jgi:hypothetical protein
MNVMNENRHLRLRDFMAEDDGWGRASGRDTYGKLMPFIDGQPGILIFRVSLKGVRRVDISFASETIVELARRYRGMKGFCFVDLKDTDQQENWNAAAERSRQPLFKWGELGTPTILGLQPSQGVCDALQYALQREEARAAEFAGFSSISITNASNKFKQLWEQGFLLRREAVAESGGMEYVYARIR